MGVADNKLEEKQDTMPNNDSELSNERAEKALKALKSCETQLRVMMYVNDTENLPQGLKQFNELNAEMYMITETMFKANMMEMYMACNKVHIGIRNRIDNLLVPFLQRVLLQGSTKKFENKNWFCPDCNNDNLDCMQKCEKCQKKRPTPGATVMASEEKSDNDDKDNNDDNDDNDDYYCVNSSKHTCE